MLEITLKAKRGNVLLDVALRAEVKWTVLFGVSGSGKSSVLRAICGLWQPEHCHVVLDGVSLDRLAPHERKIALVTHHASLVPHWSVAQNVRFAAAEAESIDTLLERFQIAHLRERRTTLLSGGEQQRVALARALASRPKVLLLDEALSGLDLQLRSQLIAELKSEKGLQIVSVTHNLTETLECADEVAMLRDGKIVQVGVAREVLRERREHLLELLGD